LTYLPISEVVQSRVSIGKLAFSEFPIGGISVGKLALGKLPVGWLLAGILTIALVAIENVASGRTRLRVVVGSSALSGIVILRVCGVVETAIRWLLAEVVAKAAITVLGESTYGNPLPWEFFCGKLAFGGGITGRILTISKVSLALGENLPFGKLALAF
jgi:hypothetical protein